MENFTPETETDKRVDIKLSGEYIDGKKKIKITATDVNSGQLVLDPAHDVRDFYCLNHPLNAQNELMRIKEVVLHLLPDNGLPPKLQMEYLVDAADATNQVEVYSFVLVNKTKKSGDGYSPRKPKFILVRNA